MGGFGVAVVGDGIAEAVIVVVAVTMAEAAATVETWFKGDTEGVAEVPAAVTRGGGGGASILWSFPRPES